MAEFDLVVRGADVVLPDAVQRLDIGVTDGLVADVGPELAAGVEEVDASGLHVFPGGVDPHVHFDDPGRTDWEGVATGTRALAAGGFTTYVDMPLNNIPVTIDGPSFDAKLPAVQESSLVDFALWGGLVAGNVERLAEQHERGVAGFKAFMCHSGIDEFPAVDDLSLYEGMKEIAALGSILLLHAENAAIVAGLGARARELGRVSPRDFVESRPVVAELEAMSRAILIAEDTGCPIHIVHVSTTRGVAMVVEARARGVDVTCETCPHYLLFAEEDVERVGIALKSAPPVRTAADRDGLWAQLADGRLPNGHVRSLTRGARGEGRGLLHRVGRDLGMSVDAPAPTRRWPLRSRASARGHRGRDRGERGRALCTSGEGRARPRERCRSRTRRSLLHEEQSSSTTFSTAIASAPTKACRSAAGSFERSCGAERCTRTAPLLPSRSGGS